ncbi:hypothetical protein D3C74_467170 [compost metagenome]
MAAIHENDRKCAEFGDFKLNSRLVCSIKLNKFTLNEFLGPIAMFNKYLQLVQFLLCQVRIPDR